VDVRIIAATNHDVEQAIATGVLREDLYYRLSVLDIHLPPLRERPEDIVPLLRFLIEKSNLRARSEQRIDGVEAEAVELLLAHSWPGNVRELWSLVERCVALGASGNLTAADVRRELSLRSRPTTRTDVAAGTEDPATVPADTVSSPGRDAPLNLEELECQTIAAALARTNNNKAAAARLLGIARKTLYEKMKRHGLVGGALQDRGGDLPREAP
jgi:transcriptional regulator with PAS, ATPase and Fis domain